MTFLEHSFSDRALLLALAMLLNLLLGGPRWLRLLLHLDAPGDAVRRLFSFFVKKMNRSHRPAATRRIRGMIMAVSVISGAFAIGWALSLLSVQGRGWMAAEVAALALLLGARQSIDLAQEAQTYLAAGKLNEVKKLLQPYVQKDLAELDRHGIARSVIEYLAHRLISGVVSPVFWYLLGGLPLALCALASHCLAFLAVRPITKFQAFGTCIALMERFFRAAPAALAVLLTMVILPLVPGTRLSRARKGLMEAQPTLASPDFRLLALMAHAFDIALLGPCAMEEFPVAYAWIGTATARLDARHVARMRLLFIYAAGVSWLLIAILSIL